jgi:hypothetical protein
MRHVLPFSRVLFALAFAATAAFATAASAETFYQSKDFVKKNCEKKSGKFAESSGAYSCDDSKSGTIMKCSASGQCTLDVKGVPSSSAPKGKSLAGTGNQNKDALKRICSGVTGALFSVENSGAYSCVDPRAGIAINCKSSTNCTEAHTPVHGH